MFAVYVHRLYLVFLATEPIPDITVTVTVSIISFDKCLAYKAFI